MGMQTCEIVATGLLKSTRGIMEATQCESSSGKVVIITLTIMDPSVAETLILDNTPSMAIININGTTKTSAIRGSQTSTTSLTKIEIIKARGHTFRDTAATTTDSRINTRTAIDSQTLTKEIFMIPMMEGASTRSKDHLTCKTASHRLSNQLVSLLSKEMEEGESMIDGPTVRRISKIISLSFTTLQRTEGLLSKRAMGLSQTKEENSTTDMVKVAVVTSMMVEMVVIDLLVTIKTIGAIITTTHPKILVVIETKGRIWIGLVLDMATGIIRFTTLGTKGTATIATNPDSREISSVRTDKAFHSRDIKTRQMSHPTLASGASTQLNPTTETESSSTNKIGDTRRGTDLKAFKDLTRGSRDPEAEREPPTVLNSTTKTITTIEDTAIDSIKATSSIGKTTRVGSVILMIRDSQISRITAARIDRTTITQGSKTKISINTALSTGKMTVSMLTMASHRMKRGSRWLLDLLRADLPWRSSAGVVSQIRSRLCTI